MKKLIAISMAFMILFLDVQRINAVQVTNENESNYYESMEELPTLLISDFRSTSSYISMNLTNGYEKFKGNYIVAKFNTTTKSAKISSSYISLSLGYSNSADKYDLYYKDSNNYEHYLFTVYPEYLDKVYANSTDVTGKGNPDSQVKITAENDVYTGVVDSDGTFKINIKKYPKSTYVNCEVSDKRGNVMNYKRSVEGNIVYLYSYISPKLTYVEGQAEANGTVEVTIGNNTYSGKVDANKKYKVTYPKQKIGTQVSIVAYDSEGHISKPITKEIVSQSVYLNINDWDVMPKAVEGKAYSGTTVRVYIGDKFYSSKVDVYGNFRVTYPTQKIGATVKIKAIDEDGYESELKNYKISERLMSVSQITKIDTDVEYVSGSWTDPDSEKIQVTVGGKTYTANMIDKYSFKIKIPKQKIGTEVKIKGTDINGYTTKTYTYKIANKPVKLTVNDMSVRNTTLYGNTEAKAKVKITIGKKTYNTTADGKGKFSLKVGYQKANTLIQVKSTNSKGYYSETNKIKVFTPSVSLYYDDIGANSTKITGQISGYASGDYVEVKIGSKTYKGNISKGKYSIKIPKQKHKTKYSLKIIDKNKNVLLSKSLKVYRTDYVQIGMTKTQVKESTWGSPTKINTYTSSSGTTEQWVYRWSKSSTSYLYFRNGKLSSIQN